MGLFSLCLETCDCTWAPLRSITEEARELRGSGEVGEQSPEAIWSRREEPRGKRLLGVQKQKHGKECLADTYHNLSSSHR